MIRSFLIDGIEYSVDSPREPVDISLSLARKDGDLIELDLLCRYGNRAPTQGISVSWSEPMQGILSVWTPTIRRNRAVKQWFAPTVTESNFASGAPVLSVVERGETNRCTVALSETVLPAKLCFCVNDFVQQEQVDYRAELLTEPREASEYSVRLRIDSRSLPIAEAISSAANWQRELYPRCLPVPRGCEGPLYSSWYSFHQHPNAKELLMDLRIAAEMGFETVIIDDGWQYEGNGTGDYYDCGDWAVAPGKFPDFAGFVRQTHELGLKLLLWFPVPFVGLNTRAFREFASRLLYVDSDFLRAGVLDPRYPEVRGHIVGLLAGYMRKYGLDGLKLDFVDQFRATPETPPYGEGMDCETVEDAVTKLMAETVAALTAVRPDCMLEFRQNYVGASITAYGNMVRVGDCAFDSLTNRIGIADLRMLCPDMAVHSDMLYWSRAETPENCAVQLINILFSVPQVSIQLAKAGPEQLSVVRRFVRYMKENADVLLHSSFAAQGAETSYSVLTAQSAKKRITALYAKDSDVFKGIPCDVFNASSSDGLLMENRTDAAATAHIFDCFGQETGIVMLNPGEIRRLSVPLGGMTAVASSGRE